MPILDTSDIRKYYMTGYNESFLAGILYPFLSSELSCLLNSLARGKFFIILTTPLL